MQHSEKERDRRQWEINGDDASSWKGGSKSSPNLAGRAKSSDETPVLSADPHDDGAKPAVASFLTAESGSEGLDSSRTRAGRIQRRGSVTAHRFFEGFHDGCPESSNGSVLWIRCATEDELSTGFLGYEFFSGVLLRE